VRQRGDDAVMQGSEEEHGGATATANSELHGSGEEMRAGGGEENG
jgi:hypothetical protein